MMVIFYYYCYYDLSPISISQLDILHLKKHKNKRFFPKTHTNLCLTLCEEGDENEEMGKKIILNFLNLKSKMLLDALGLFN